jgi:hypothetical protein
VSGRVIKVEAVVLKKFPFTPDIEMAACSSLLQIVAKTFFASLPQLQARAQVDAGDLHFDKYEGHPLN